MPDAQKIPGQAGLPGITMSEALEMSWPLIYHVL